MRQLNNQNTDPHYNMALEEHVLRVLSQEDSYFMLWQNSPAVIVGRNQNALEEINAQFVRDNNIAVVRRLTGGGAVYHDAGNLNFTFVVRQSKAGFHFARFAQPVIRALGALGVRAEHTGRNDITIEGRKFSGNAEYRLGDKLLHHGTLLFNSDLSMLSQALMVKESKIAGKGVQSVRSRVTNICEYLSPTVSIQDFKDALTVAAKEEFGSLWQSEELKNEDHLAVKALQLAKYATWEWNFGRAPAFNLQRVERFAFGEVDLRLNVKDGVIRECRIYGDFFTHADIGELASALIGLCYREEDLAQALSGLDLGHYFPGMNEKELLALLTG
ncbi:MAG: lipoate--protein ligase [Peptococcaceae bacterium]|nr:lipoate--protein ligase [Peptococcaceae bacterium]